MLLADIIMNRIINNHGVFGFCPFNVIPVVTCSSQKKGTLPLTKLNYKINIL